MNDFVLSLRKDSAGFTICTSNGEQAPLAFSSLPSSVAAAPGHWLYQQIFKGPILERYREHTPHRLLLYLPDELFDWPWSLLHDGVCALALRHPIVLLPAARQDYPMPALRLEQGPLRLLLTLAPGEEQSATGKAIVQMIEALRERHADRVSVTPVPQLDARRLYRAFRDASAPFHLWHHIGSCRPDFALVLADAAPGVHNLNFLLGIQPGMRCFVLSTQQEAPSASALCQLNVPFLLCQSAQPNPAPELLQGFYSRLLTHDLAIACTLARLENDPIEVANEEKSRLITLAQTPELHLGPIRVSRRRVRRSSVTRTRVRILVLKANPRHRAQAREGLRIDQEMKEIKFAMRENWRFFDWREENARIQDFSGYLLSHHPAILHFSGHALPSGELALEQYTTLSETHDGVRNSTGLSAEPDPIPFSTIAGILGNYQDTLRCVVLNACYTEPLAEAICDYIDCAIGMREAINDGLAIRFSELFYRALAYGESVGQAFRKACSEISLRYQASQAQLFHLKCKPGVDPDSLFFVHIEEDNL